MAATGGEKPTTPPLWESFFAGAIGGIANTIVGHPLDTLKVSPVAWVYFDLSLIPPTTLTNAVLDSR